MRHVVLSHLASRYLYTHVRFTPYGTPFEVVRVFDSGTFFVCELRQSRFTAEWTTPVWEFHGFQVKWTIAD